MKKLLSIGAAAILLAAPVALAGPIPLSKCQVIDKSGSYVMTGNIMDPPGSTIKGFCLYITAQDVTIDMNGFAMIGSGSRGFTEDYGVKIAVGGAQVTLLNGTITGFSLGVDTPGGPPRLDGVAAENCIDGADIGGLVSNSRFLNNLSIGLNGGQVDLGNIVSGNGFGLGTAGAAILFNTVEDNRGYNIQTGTPCPSAGIAGQPGCVEFGNEGSSVVVPSQ